MTAVIERPSPGQLTYAPQGRVRDLWDCRGVDEVMVSGPAGTGKSRAILEYLYMLCCLHPGIRILIARATRTSLTESGLVTFEQHVVPRGHGWVRNQIRRVRQSYELPNGSEIVVGGLDNTARIMSTEFDCVVGDTLVTSPSEIQRSYQRPYSGQLVTITTASGNQLTGTPNHPIFTDQGWVALGALCEGDYVVSRTLVQDVGASGYPDVQNQPTTIAEVARTLVLSQSSRSERVETVGMDFHGDGANGYVDVVSAAGRFHSRFDTAIDEPVIENDCRRGYLEQSALMAVRTSIQRRFRGDTSSIPGLSVVAELPHAFSIRSGIDPPLARGSGRLGESLFPLRVGVSDMSQRLPFTGSADAQTALGQTLLETSGSHVRRFSGFAQPEFPFDVTTDRVVNVTVRDARDGEHVYNLQTGDNWYVANGIISHNCIYVQEAREIEESSWEDLTSRLRNGKLPWQQIIGDTNPDGPTHWIQERARTGRLKLIESRHEDNPVLFDAHRGEMTDAGKVYIGRLDNLTGVRHKRLRLGLWVGAENLIYDLWDPAVHVIDPFEIPEEWPRFRAIDFGYTNPFSCLWGALDDDRRLYIYREVYGVQKLVRDWAHLIHDLSGKERYLATVTDHDVEGREDLDAHLGHGASQCRVAGVNGASSWTTPAVKDVQPGIERVSQRMKLAGDQSARLYVFSNALVARDPLVDEAKHPCGVIEELPRYAWAKARSQLHGEVMLEQPMKQYDHSLDALRYMVMHIDSPMTGFNESVGQGMNWQGFQTQPQRRAVRGAARGRR